MTSQNMQAYKKQIGLFLLLVLVLLVVGYKCPIRYIFGIPCPGCKFTTSLYYLLKGDIQTSLVYHAMLIPSIVNLGLLIVFSKNKKVFDTLLWIWIVLMFGYYIYRMIFIFPDYPMYMNENALLFKMIQLFN
ncbi:MAG: DUF2752 domain-containing protein [Holdemanella sp.]|nr:DUF2752 domain-containing protein [Holdemanella sp.]